MKSGVDLYEVDGENLKPMLAALEEVERWDVVYRLTRSALLVLGGLCWLIAVHPAVGARPRTLVLGMWAALFGLLVISLIAGRVWRRRCDRFRM
jgi:hypothetical protein